MVFKVSHDSRSVEFKKFSVLKLLNDMYVHNFREGKIEIFKDEEIEFLVTPNKALDTRDGSIY